MTEWRRPEAYVLIKPPNMEGRWTQSGFEMLKFLLKFPDDNLDEKAAEEDQIVDDDGPCEYWD